MQKIYKLLRSVLLLMVCILISSVGIAQRLIQQFSMDDDVKITIDIPLNYSSVKKTIMAMNRLICPF